MFFSCLSLSRVEKTHHAVWKEPAIYDPNNPLSKKYEKIIGEKTPVERDESYVAVQSAQPSATASEVSESRYFQVRSTYHDLFASKTASGFSILGEPLAPKKEAPLFSLGLGASEEVTAQATAKRKLEAEEQAAAAKKAKLKAESVLRISHDPEETRQKLKKTPLFFFHLDSPTLSGCATRFATIDKFQRVDTMDEVVSGWEEYRSRLTMEYKRKHKSTTRKKARMGRKRKPV